MNHWSPPRLRLLVVAALLAAAALGLAMQGVRPAGKARLHLIARSVIHPVDPGRAAHPLGLAAWSLARGEAPLVAARWPALEAVERAHDLWPGDRRSFSSPALPGLLRPLATMPPGTVAEVLGRALRFAGVLMAPLLWLLLPPVVLGRGVRGDPWVAAALWAGMGAMTHALVLASPALLAAAALTLGLALLQRGRDVAAGVALGLAALTSEACLALPLVLALTGRWRACSAAVVMIAAGVAAGLGTAGLSAWPYWLREVFGAWLVEALHVWPVLGSMALGAGLAVALPGRRGRVPAEVLAAASVVAGLLFSPLRDAADPVLALPALALLLRRPLGEGTPGGWRLISVGVVMVVMIASASASLPFLLLTTVGLLATGVLLLAGPGSEAPAETVAAGRLPGLVLLAVLGLMVDFAGFTRWAGGGEVSLAGWSAVYAVLVVITLGWVHRLQRAGDSAPLLPPGAGRWLVPLGAAVLMALWAPPLAARVAATPLFYPQADMLPLIQQVARAALAGRASIHDVFYPLGEWGYYCTYWPGLWMAYLPGEAFGWDLRAISLAAVAGALALLLVVGVPRTASAGVPGMVIGVLLALMLASPIPRALPVVQTAPVWLALAGVLAGIGTGRGWLAAISVGLLAAMRFPMVGLVPVVGVVLWRLEGSARPWRLALLAAAPLVLLLVPHVVADPVAFVEATLLRQIEYHDDLGRQAAPYLGLAGVAQVLGLKLPGGLLLALGMATSVVAAWRWARTPGDHLLVVAGYVAVFCLVTPVPFYYSHVKLLLAAAAVLLWRGGEDPGPVPFPSPRLLVVAAVLVPMLLLLADWPRSPMLRRTANHLDVPELVLRGFEITGPRAPILMEPRGGIGLTARGGRAGTLLVRLERLDRGPEGTLTLRWNQHRHPAVMIPVEGPFEVPLRLAPADVLRGGNALMIEARWLDGRPMTGNLRLVNLRWVPD